MTYYTIGSKSISATLLIAFMSLIIGYVTFFFVRKKDPERKTIADLITNHFILFIVLWKLSLIIIQPKLVLGNLMSLVYFTGGRMGFVIGLLITTLSLIYQIKRKKFSLNSSQINSLILILVSYGSYGILTIMITRFNVLGLLQFLIALLLLILMFSKGKLANRLTIIDGLLWYMIIMLFLTFIIPPSNQHVGFTYQQILFIFTALYSLLLHKRIIKLNLG